MVPERGTFSDFQGSEATGPDFNEKTQTMVMLMPSYGLRPGYDDDQRYGSV